MSVFHLTLILYRRIYKTGGTRGFYRGLGMTIARDAPGGLVYFISYEMLVRSVTQ